MDRIVVDEETAEGKKINRRLLDALEYCSTCELHRHGQKYPQWVQRLLLPPTTKEDLRTMIAKHPGLAVTSARVCGLNVYGVDCFNPADAEPIEKKVVAHFAYKIAHARYGVAKKLQNREQSKSTRTRTGQQLSDTKVAADTLCLTVSLAAAAQARSALKDAWLSRYDQDREVTCWDPKTNSLLHFIGTTQWARTVPPEGMEDATWIGWDHDWAVLHRAKTGETTIMLCGSSDGQGLELLHASESPGTAVKYSSALPSFGMVWFVHGGGVVRSPVGAYLQGNQSASRATFRLLGGATVVCVHRGSTAVLACARGILLYPLARLPNVRCFVAESFDRPYVRSAPDAVYFVKAGGDRNPHRIVLNEKPDWRASGGGGPIPMVNLTDAEVAYQRDQDVHTLKIPVIGVADFEPASAVPLGTVTGTLLAGVRTGSGRVVLSLTSSIVVFPGKTYEMPPCTHSQVVGGGRIVWRDAVCYRKCARNGWAKVETTAVPAHVGPTAAKRKRKHSEQDQRDKKIAT